MLRLEDLMELQKLDHDGLSVSEIARQMSLDRKTVRKYLKHAPGKYERKTKSWKVDRGGRICGIGGNTLEMQKRGYEGCLTQVKKVVRPWRSERQERAFVQFEAAPDEQAQMDWGHWDGKRLFGFCADSRLVADAVR
jgi:transposase